MNTSKTFNGSQKTMFNLSSYCLNIPSDIVPVIDAAVLKTNRIFSKHFPFDVAVRFCIGSTKGNALATSKNNSGGLHTIEFNASFISKVVECIDEEEVRRVINIVVYHEIAHVIDNYYRPNKSTTSHGKDFKLVMRLFGFSPEDSKSTLRIPPCLRVEPKRRNVLTRYVFKCVVTGKEIMATKKWYDKYANGHQLLTVSGNPVEFVKVVKV